MKKTLFIASILGVSALTAPLASAGEFQISGGGEYMFDSSDTELAFTMATGRAAYFFNETFGIEGEASFGLSDVNNFDNSGLDIELNNQFGIYGVARMPAGQNGELFGRFGFRAGTLDASLGNISEELDYNGVSFGAGYNYFFSETVGVRAEVTTSGASLDNNFDPDGNLTSFGLSLIVKFDK